MHSASFCAANLPSYWGVGGRQKELVVLVPLNEQDTVTNLSSASRIQTEPAIESKTVEFGGSSQ